MRRKSHGKRHPHWDWRGLIFYESHGGLGSLINANNFLFEYNLIMAIDRDYDRDPQRFRANREAGQRYGLALYLRGRQLPEAQIAREIEQISPLLTLTRRGALIYAQKTPGP